MNYWNHPGVPHKGWTYLGAQDTGSADHTCEMCGQKNIRFVHTVEHPEHEALEVGCDCAEKMSEDYVTPKDRQKRAQKTANRARREAKALAEEEEWLKLREEILERKRRFEEQCRAPLKPR